MTCHQRSSCSGATWSCCLLVLTVALLLGPSAWAAPQDPPVVAGGATIDDAAAVEPGSYVDSVAVGESRFYALSVPAGQVPAAAIAVEALPGEPVVAGGTLHLGLLGADRGLISDAYATVEFTGQEQRQLQSVAELAPESGTATSTYYVGVALRQGAGAAPAGAQRYPLRLVVATVDRAAPPAASPSPSEAVAAPLARERPRAGAAPADRPSGLPPGLFLGASTVSFLLGAALGFLRVRAKHAPLARGLWLPGARRGSGGRRAASTPPATRKLTGLREGGQP